MMILEKFLRCIFREREKREDRWFDDPNSFSLLPSPRIIKREPNAKTMGSFEGWLHFRQPYYFKPGIQQYAICFFFGCGSTNLISISILHFRSVFILFSNSCNFILSNSIFFSFLQSFLLLHLSFSSVLSLFTHSLNFLSTNFYRSTKHSHLTICNPLLFHPLVFIPINLP